LANMTEFGVTQAIPFKDLTEVGYDCVIYPVSEFRITLRAVDMFLNELS
jgi:methylisocitrate lyase